MKPVYVPTIHIHDVPNHGGAMSDHLGLVLHVQQGNDSLVDEFSTGEPPNRKSSTWWISKAGRIERYVPPDLEAWAQGEGNATYNSVETEGFVDEEFTLLQLAGLVHVYKRGMEMFGWHAKLANVVGQRGLGVHGMGGAAWGGHPACPGYHRSVERNTIVTLASGHTARPYGASLKAQVVEFKKVHNLGNDTPEIGPYVRELLSM